MIDTIFNVLLLLFWLQIWIGHDKSLSFNPYAAPWARTSNSIMGFLQPAFLGLPAKAVASLALVFLLVLRGVAAPREPSGWILNLGFEIRQPLNESLLSHIAFSFVSFGIFLFKLCGLSLIFVRTGKGIPSLHTTAALYHMARPFTLLNIRLRPLVFLGMGIAFALLLNLVGNPVPQEALRLMLALNNLPQSTLQAGGVAALFKLAISTMYGFVQILSLLQQFVILLIIGSWVSILSHSHGVAFFCREWMDLLLGPLRRYPLRLGTLDLTPLVFMFLLFLIQMTLRGMLLRSYVSLS